MITSIEFIWIHLEGHRNYNRTISCFDEKSIWIILTTFLTTCLTIYSFVEFSIMSNNTVIPNYYEICIHVFQCHESECVCACILYVLLVVFNNKSITIEYIVPLSLSYHIYQNILISFRLVLSKVVCWRTITW